MAAVVENPYSTLRWAKVEGVSIVLVPDIQLRRDFQVPDDFDPSDVPRMLVAQAGRGLPIEGFGVSGEGIVLVMGYPAGHMLRPEERFLHEFGHFQGLGHHDAPLGVTDGNRYLTRLMHPTQAASEDGVVLDQPRLSPRAVSCRDCDYLRATLAGQNRIVTSVIAAEVALNYSEMACLDRQPDPVEPRSTQCTDGRDNDSDGWVDGLDPGCSSDSDNDEADDPVGQDRGALCRANAACRSLCCDAAERRCQGNEPGDVNVGCLEEGEVLPPEPVGAEAEEDKVETFVDDLGCECRSAGGRDPTAMLLLLCLLGIRPLCRRHCPRTAAPVVVVLSARPRRPRCQTDRCPQPSTLARNDPPLLARSDPPAQLTPSAATTVS